VSGKRVRLGPNAGERALTWLRGCLSRRQGRYVVDTEPPGGWLGSGGHERHKRGWSAEEYAAQRLEGMGYRVLGRNVRVGRGEIDIIAQQGSTLVFVEVKAGMDDPDYAPRDRVGPEKSQQLIALGEIYIKQHRLGDVHYRFDVAEVILGEDRLPKSLDVRQSAL